MAIDNTLAVPAHIGFILDGNRRWAKQRNLSVPKGHMAGYAALKEVLYECFDRGVAYVSIYAFSSENWKRGEAEVSALMQLALAAVARDLRTLVKKNVRVCFLGQRGDLPANIGRSIAKSEAATSHLTGGTLAVCFNYGGQQEIVDAARQCVADGLAPSEVTEDAIAKRLYAPAVPPLDLIVRTSGEQRLSNFMLWRAAYSELLFLEKLWPDMTKDDVTAIIEEYNRRSRRFGG